MSKLDDLRELGYELELIPGDEMQSHLWDGCLELIQPNDAIEVVKNDNEVIFTVESWGQLDPLEMLFQACDGFTRTLKEFEKLV